MLASQGRIHQPHIRSFGPKLRPVARLHPLAKHEQVCENEDVAQFVYDFLAGCPRGEAHHDIRRKPHFPSVMESGWG